MKDGDLKNPMIRIESLYKKKNHLEETNPSLGFFSVDLFFKWVFPKIGVPQNGWFLMENSIKMDDLGVKPIFLETPK